MKNNILQFSFSVFLSLILIPFGYTQTERILNFDVDIQVNKDRSIKVIEDITVYANGDQIKRGLKRSLPLSRNLNGKTKNINYKITHIEKDGVEEPYFSENSGRNKVLYIGRKDVFLDPGTYRYIIEYTAANQVGVFEKFDELYWNPIGTDWDFAVEKASCTVWPPEGANMIQHACYTGGYGQREKNCSAEAVNSGAGMRFVLSQPLNPGQGLTVGVGFEKGNIEPPTLFERLGTSIIIGLASLAMIFYFFMTWQKYGVDPPKPTPYPIFDVPHQLSPAGMGYVAKETYKANSITSSIIHLAIKGYLRIDERKEKSFFSSTTVYDLTELKTDYTGLPPDEKSLMSRLFSNGSMVSIDGEYDKHIKKAYEGHREAVRLRHKDFVTEGNNRKFIIFPILLTLIVAFVSIVWISDMNDPGINLKALVVFIPLAIAGIITYAILIKKPTKEKLALQSEIEGFKMYLEMAEKDRMNLLNPPERTPEHFEAMLPFAYALGVEHIWSKIFKNVLERAMYEPEWSNNPHIYHTHNFSTSFSQSMSSAATPPSSSGGGSGGGGFSGGGGGGGGGGGW